MIGGSVGIEKTLTDRRRPDLRSYADLILILTYVASLWTVLPVLMTFDRLRARARRALRPQSASRP